jgi:hypothetical protein
MKYVFAAAAVLLIALGVVFYIGPGGPVDPKLKQLGQIAELAERVCLSNTQSEQSASIKLNLEAINTSLRSDAAVSRKSEALRGAATSLSEAVKKVEDNDIRTCMAPWSEQIRALASSLS